MGTLNSKGVSKTALAHLKRLYPDSRPKLGETLEQIHRREGQQEVLAYIQKVLVDG